MMALLNRARARDPVASGPITRMRPLNEGQPRPAPARKLSAVALAEVHRLVGVLLECEIEPLLTECDEQERPVAQDWLTAYRVQHASQMPLSLVLPRVRRYMTAWTSVINAAYRNRDAHILVVLIAEEWGKWEAAQFEAPPTYERNTRYSKEAQWESTMGPDWEAWMEPIWDSWEE